MTTIQHGDWLSLNVIEIVLCWYSVG